MRASLLHPHDENGPQLPKIRCAFHNNELLTNFCSCRGCLLPLCPSCIKIHINEHFSLKTTPQLENINDLIRNLHGKLQTYSQRYNSLYKQLANVESNIEQFRQKLVGKIQQVKHDLIAAVQDHFKRIELQSLQKINELGYVKYVNKCKDITKKVILSLKSSQRNFFAEESKIMRMMIKFQSNMVGQELETFHAESQHFVDLHSAELLSFHIRNNMVQLAIDNLHSSFKIDFEQPIYQHQPKDITPIIKELYEKHSDKREIKKSLYKFLSNKNTPNKQTQSLGQFQITKNIVEPVMESKIKDFAEMISSKQAMSISQARPQLQEIAQNSQQQIDFELANEMMNVGSYSSVKESIVKATQDLNLTFCRNIRREMQNEKDHAIPRRRSMSKGKGITIMNPMSTIDYKKTVPQNFRSIEVDLNFMSSKTEQIPRKCR